LDGAGTVAAGHCAPPPPPEPAPAKSLRSGKRHGMGLTWPMQRRGEGMAISFPWQPVMWEEECTDARCGKLQKEMCVNSFVSVSVSLVKTVANAFF
jgi:hypothetical protein